MEMILADTSRQYKLHPALDLLTLEGDICARMQVLTRHTSFRTFSLIMLFRGKD